MIAWLVEYEDAWNDRNVVVVGAENEAQARRYLEPNTVLRITELPRDAMDDDIDPSPEDLERMH